MIALDWSDWIAIYAAVVATSQVGYEIWRHQQAEKEKQKQAPKLEFSLKLGAKIIKSHNYIEGENTASLYLRKAPPLQLVITNNGGTTCIVTEVRLVGSKVTPAELPVSVEPAKRSFCTLGFPDDFQYPLTIQAVDNTGRVYDGVVKLPDLFDFDIEEE